MGHASHTQIWAARSTFLPILWVLPAPSSAALPSWSTFATALWACRRFPFATRGRGPPVGWVGPGTPSPLPRGAGGLP